MYDNRLPYWSGGGRIDLRNTHKLAEQGESAAYRNFSGTGLPGLSDSWRRDDGTGDIGPILYHTSGCVSRKNVICSSANLWGREKNPG
jgi:hypothetical protein